MFSTTLPQFSVRDAITTTTGTPTTFGLRVFNAIRQSLLQQVSPVAFANLPASPVIGMVFAVTDSTVNTWGATVAGGGGLTVLAWWNGSHWTVIGA